jgi:hypothetical protein
MSVIDFNASKGRRNEEKNIKNCEKQSIKTIIRNNN